MLSKRNLDKTSPPPDYRLYVENVEHQENPEIDALFATTMGNAIIDIPADSPFKGTDLVVFKDGTRVDFLSTGSMNRTLKKPLIYMKRSKIDVLSSKSTIPIKSLKRKSLK